MISLSLFTLIACQTPDTGPAAHQQALLQQARAGGTAATAETSDTALSSPWATVFLESAATVNDDLGNPSVAAVDDEVWVTWERNDALIHVQRLTRFENGVRTATADVGGPAIPESFVPAIHAKPGLDSVVVQRLVDCDPAIHGSCGLVPYEVELVWVDRATMATTILPVTAPSSAGLEKGRGNFTFTNNGLITCFKAFGPGFRDEVVCAERNRSGWRKEFNPSGLAPNADDHPAVAMHNGQPVVAFTSARTGTRSTWLWADGSVFPMMIPTDRGEDPVLVSSGGELLLTWVERATAVDRIMLATCGTATCGSYGDWAIEEVVRNTRLGQPSLATQDGVPVILYADEDQRVKLAAKCPAGWHFEQPWEHGVPQSIKHGQPSIVSSADGALHLTMTQFDQGIESVWYGTRPGPVCP